MSGAANQWASTLNRWTTSNASTKMPRAVYGDPGGFNRISDRYVEDASYLRLKNLQIGYRFSPEVLEKLKIVQNLRIYFSAINLLTVTNYSGLDPENSGVPPSRQFLFGINLGL